MGSILQYSLDFKTVKNLALTANLQDSTSVFLSLKPAVHYVKPKFLNKPQKQAKELVKLVHGVNEKIIMIGNLVFMFKLR